MSRRRSKSLPSPPCYAMVLPGLESVAADEIKDTLNADVKKSSHGVVVFRAGDIDLSILGLRTTEDVFLLGWGTDELTHRAVDLKSIEKWTEKHVHWDHLLKIHHNIRPKPSGKPTYRLVCQMTGKHAYRRVDALKALTKGLADKLPASWKPVEENAAVEIWLTINGKTAICGLRLSDRTMRHREYKQEHIPASLRPTMAAAMIRLATSKGCRTIIDPMCGAGTILAEQWSGLDKSARRSMQLIGGDRELDALRSARANLRDMREIPLLKWDALRLPLPPKSVDRIISNPPFGKQLGDPSEIGSLYRNMVKEYDRVLRPSGKVVLLVADYPALKKAAESRSWKQQRLLNVRVLGQKATISVWTVRGA